MLKDAKSVTFSDLKGHSVLTSGQNVRVLKRMRPPRPDYERKTTDPTLTEAWKSLLHDLEPSFNNLWSNVEKGIQDPQLTKDFCHWDVTIQSIDGYLSKDFEYDFGHLKSYRAARRIVKDMFSGVSLSPVCIDCNTDLSIVWSNPDASAGAIGRGSKKDNESECLSAFKKLKDGIRDHLPFSDLQIPALPAHRAQLGGFYNTTNYDDHTYLGSPKQKDRLVWIVDGGTNLLEAQYGLPLQKYLSVNCNWYAGGKTPEDLRRSMRPLLEYDIYWLSLDYSKYDQTVPARVIHDVFVDIVRPLFPDECEDELKFIEYNFIHTKMLLPQDKLVVKHRGIPSGSLFTQIIGTVCNLLIGLTFLCSRKKGSEEEIISYVLRNLRFPRGGGLMISIMGDDNIWGLTSFVSKEEWAEYVERVFNMKIHPDKCADARTFNYPEYLKRLFTPKGEKMNLLYLVLNTIHPERGMRSYDGYSPWHILYGLFYTYRGSFRDPELVEEYLVSRMNHSGGLQALKTLPPRELPGVLRGYSNKAKEQLFLRANAVSKYSDPTLSD